MIEKWFADKAPWPPKPHQDRLSSLARFNALFEGDTAVIKAWAKRYRKRQYELNEFVPYPVPEIAARTLSSFLFGEDARLTSEVAQDELNLLIEENHLHALNQEASVTCAVEGEVYYKLDIDEEISDHAIFSVVPAAAAFPYFKFGRLVEVAFVAQLDISQLGGENDENTVVRHVEQRWKGRIVHKLFKGSADSLGDPMDLGDHPETEDLDEEITDLPDDLLVRHVPFWRSSRSPHGISIFRGKEGLVDAIYGLYSQDQHDAEMSKRRVAIPSSYLKRDSKGNPVFDRNLDLFELDEAAEGALGSDRQPIHPVEFTDSTVMGDRIAQRIDEFLLACGIAPQSAGRDVAGAAESGTARKLAQALTLMTISTAARYFRPALKDLIDLALWDMQPSLISGQTMPSGDPDVNVEMQDGFVDDPVETAQMLATLRGAGIISTEQAIRERHPDWDDDEVQLELERILEEEGAKIPQVDFTDEPPSGEPEPQEEPTAPGRPQGPPAANVTDGAEAAV